MPPGAIPVPCSVALPARAASRIGAALRSRGYAVDLNVGQSRFRCDLPAVAYRMALDQRAVLSPSHDGPMYALSVCSTPSEQWKDFVLDFSDFAGMHAGVPLLHQSRGATVAQFEAAYGKRLTLFRQVRQKLDPGDRFANPFLLQYMF